MQNIANGKMASLNPVSIKEVQAGKINYEEFCKGIKASGCAYYIVYINGKQILMEVSL